MGIDAVRASHEERLMRLPNVTGVGVGTRGTEAVIKVFVTHKVPDATLRPGERIPRTLDGIGVDVEAIGAVTAQGR